MFAINHGEAIRQDSKTGLVLEDKIRELLATRRAQLKATIYGSRTQVRVLEGGTSQTSKLVGFVHNPKPDPAVLFDITRFLLACIGSGKRPSTRVSAIDLYKRLAGTNQKNLVTFSRLAASTTLRRGVFLVFY